MNRIFKKVLNGLFFSILFFSIHSTSSAQSYIAYESNGKWGLKDKNGNIILSPLYDAIDEFKDGYAPVYKRGSIPCPDARYPEVILNGVRDYLMGVIDSTGRLIKKLAFLDIRPYSEGLAAIFNPEYQKFGFINKYGKLVIPYNFLRVFDFKNGLAIVKPNRYFQVINKAGTAITTGKYDTICPFINGLAKVKTTAGFGLINSKGVEIVKPKYIQMGEFSDGLCLVKDANGWGYINNKGKVIITPKFYSATDFTEGRAAVKLIGTSEGAVDPTYWKFIDKTGKSITTAQYGVSSNMPNFNYKFSGGLLISNNSYPKYGMLDTSGKEIIPFVYGSFGPFKNGLAKVTGIGKNITGVIAYINKANKFIIPYNVYLSDAQDFSEGLAAIKTLKDQLWGFMDTTGKWIVQPKYINVMPFYNGLAAVQVQAKNAKWGFIDKTGKEVIAPKYNSVVYTKEGFYKVGIKDLLKSNSLLYGLVNNKGVEFVPAKYIELQDFSEGLAVVGIEEIYNYTIQRFGFIDTTGKLVIPTSYDSAEPFLKGRARVTLVGKCFLIDKIDQ